MRNIVWLSTKTANSYVDIMAMPYIAFRCHIYYLQEFEDAYANANNTNNPTTDISVTEPDMSRISPFLQKRKAVKHGTNN